jgi:hypothetical protein
LRLGGENLQSVFLSRTDVKVSFRNFPSPWDNLQNIALKPQKDEKAQILQAIFLRYLCELCVQKGLGQPDGSAPLR